MTSVTASNKLIKSIQRGVVDITGATVTNATITSVNTSRAVLNDLGGSLNASGAYPATTVSPGEQQSYWSLTGSTQVTCTRATNLSSGATTLRSFQVVEYTQP